MLVQYIVVRFYFSSSIEPYILFGYYEKKLDRSLYIIWVLYEKIRQEF